MYDEKEQMLSLGLSGYKSFFWTKWINFFVYMGLHTFYYYDSYRYSYHYEFPIDEEEEYTYLIVGIGPGVELHLWRISLSLMAGLGYYAKLKESQMINLTGECGLHFCF